MKRWVFRILTALSLTAFIGTGVLYFYSYHYAGEVSYEAYSGSGFDHSFSVSSLYGWVVLRLQTGGDSERGPILSRSLDRTWNPIEDEFPPALLRSHEIAVNSLGARRFMGFVYWTDGHPGERGNWCLRVPIWFLMLLALPIPTLTLYRKVRIRRRSSREQCPA